MPSVTAIVPMRHFSERVPGKNYRDFAGRPLFHRILETLLECPSVNAVVVDTDSATIRDDTRTRFPAVVLLERPPHLRDPHMSMNDVLINTVGNIDGDFFLQTHSTNPLLTRRSIESAIGTFFDRYPEKDSLFSVTRRQARFWDSAGKPVNHELGVLLRTQDMEPLFEENSCIYLFSREGLLKCENRIGTNPIPFEVSGSEALDIDDEETFKIAEHVFSLRAPG
jgi:CMP-N-acetylneuraminic acid synthetase